MAHLVMSLVNAHLNFLLIFLKPKNVLLFVLSSRKKLSCCLWQMNLQPLIDLRSVDVFSDHKFIVALAKNQCSFDQVALT